MRPHELDVSPERNERYLAGIRQMSPARRGELLNAMVRDTRTLLVAGLRHRRPDATEAQLRWLTCEALYGRDFTERVLGPSP